MWWLGEGGASCGSVRHRFWRDARRLGGIGEPVHAWKVFVGARTGRIRDCPSREARIRRRTPLVLMVTCTLPGSRTGSSYLRSRRTILPPPPQRSRFRCERHWRRSWKVSVVGVLVTGRSGTLAAERCAGVVEFYAVPDNSRRLSQFVDAVIKHWLRTLQRRSQTGRDRWTWPRMQCVARRYLPRPIVAAVGSDNRHPSGGRPSGRQWRACRTTSLRIRRAVSTRRADGLRIAA